MAYSKDIKKPSVPVKCGGCLKNATKNVFLSNNTNVGAFCEECAESVVSHLNRRARDKEARR
jgi:predicted sulfurtransferase